MESKRDTEGTERLVRLLNHNRAVLDQAIWALNTGHDALAELETMLGGGGRDCRPQTVVAVTAALQAHQATGQFLDMMAAAYRDAAGPPAKYRVTCAGCGAANTAEWTDDLPPGGVSPVECAECGYMILSESEGNPVLASGDAV